MTTATVETPEKTKLCRGKCRQRLPVTKFRLMNRERGYRHSRCGDCRREEDRQKAAKKRSHAMTDGLRRIRRACTSRQIATLVTEIASELGGIEEFTREFIARAEAEKDHGLLKAARTLFHMLIVCELERVTDLLTNQSSETPEAAIHRLHGEQKLSPVLQEMYLSGEISLDDMDPPPAALA